MDARLKAAGVISTVSGALLLVALLLDWWGLPPAFEEPASLPDAAAFAADAHRMSVPELVFDAYQWFEFRDILWLATGVAGFSLGLIALIAPRFVAPAAVIAGLLALVGAILVIFPLVSPPDFAEVALKEGARREPEFGVELPLSREPGVFVTLAAQLGIAVGAALALARAGGWRRPAPDAS